VSVLPSAVPLVLEPLPAAADHFANSVAPHACPASSEVPGVMLHAFEREFRGLRSELRKPPSSFRCPAVGVSEDQPARILPDRPWRERCLDGVNPADAACSRRSRRATERSRSSDRTHWSGRAPAHVPGRTVSTSPALSWPRNLGEPSKPASSSQSRIHPASVRPGDGSPRVHSEPQLGCHLQEQRLRAGPADQLDAHRQPCSRAAPGPVHGDTDGRKAANVDHG
jgi:hypothetical protein